MDIAKKDFDELSITLGHQRMMELCLEYITISFSSRFNPLYAREIPEEIPEELPSSISNESSIMEEPIVPLEETAVALEQPVMHLPSKEILKTRELHWPFMRAKNFVRELYTGNLSNMPKRLNYKKALEILADAGQMSVEQLIQMNPVDYAHKYLYRYSTSCFTNDENRKYLVNKILHKYLLKDSY